MSEIRGTEQSGEPRRGLPALVRWGAALIGVAVLLYVIGAVVFKPTHDLKTLVHGDMAKLDLSAAGKPAPATPLLDPAGRTVSLADLKAPVTLVNLWATWCAPCVKEMPTLAALQAAYPGRIKVVAISMDRPEDREKARAFVAQHPPLTFYQDPKYALAFALDPPAAGFPTTVIYDARGVERARLSGDANWNGKDAHAVVEALLASR